MTGVAVLGLGPVTSLVVLGAVVAAVRSWPWALALGLILSAIGDRPATRDVLLAATLVLGLGVFLLAMRWDSSDPRRVTRRSDVAFWLHLLAAPMIVHPVFTLLGLNDGQGSLGEGVVVVALYVALGLTALAIDRRALLVSALAYVLWALTDLFERFGAVGYEIHERRADAVVERAEHPGHIA